MLKNYINKKILRLKVSKNVLKLNYLYHKYFGEKNTTNIGLNFSDKPSRIKIIQDTINRKNYKSFLEIGSYHNELFDNITCKKKIGVDPYSGGNVRKTSDDFFLNNTSKFDIIFIDGLHEYQQVKKDILNSLKILNHDGVVMLHDCLPDTFFHQAIPRCQYVWNGDVWKAIVEIRTFDDLDTYTCYADFGIGIILKRKNKFKLNINSKNFSKLKFKDYQNNFKKFMNIIDVKELNNLF